MLRELIDGSDDDTVEDELAATNNVAAYTDAYVRGLTAACRNQDGDTELGELVHEE